MGAVIPVAKTDPVPPLVLNTIIPLVGLPGEIPIVT